MLCVASGSTRLFTLDSAIPIKGKGFPVIAATVTVYAALQ
jgi:hypothetical protein